MSLPTLATPKALSVRVGRPETDQLLLSKLRSASSRFRAAVHHDVSRVVDDVLYLDGPGSRVLLVPGPIESVGSFVLLSDDGDPANDRTLVRNRDYRISRRDGILTSCFGFWPAKLEFAKLTYTHGYDAAPDHVDENDASRLAGVPDEIQDAVLDMAEVLVNTELGVQGRTVLGDSVQYGSTAAVGTTQSWADAVNNYSWGQGDRA